VDHEMLTRGLFAVGNLLVVHCKGCKGSASFRCIFAQDVDDVWENVKLRNIH